MKWFAFTRGTIHQHRVDAPLRAVRELASKLNLSSVDETLYINRGEKLWWAWDNEQIVRLSKEIIKLGADPLRLQKHFHVMEQYAVQAFKAADKIHTTDLSKLSDADVIERYEYLYNESKYAYALMNTDVDAIDIYPVEHLHILIKKSLPKEFLPEKVGAISFDLSTPAHISYIAEEEIELLRVALGKSEGNKSAWVKVQMEEITENYWWTSLGWESMKVKSNDDFKHELGDVENRYPDPKKRIRELQEMTEKILAKRKELTSLYKLGAEIEALLELFDKYARYHDMRKEMQMKTTYGFFLLMCEVARRKKIFPDDLEWLLHEEVFELLRGEPLNKKLVEERKKITAILVKGSDISCFSGSEAEALYKKEIQTAASDIRELKGMSASRGKVQCIARICNGAKDAAEKIKIGDILITGMTLPDYVPSMKKAAAIVTDEGGITSHAAIVSRELGKPCVIGTKI